MGAMARVSEFTDTYPKSRMLMYQRIGLRQQQLFAIATESNQDYFGSAASAPLDGLKRADLADIADPVPTPEQIQRVEVYGTDADPSAPAVGTEIAIVPLGDLVAEDPPRATLRDLVFQGVPPDLAHVTDILVYFARVSASYGGGDAATQVELPAPYDILLDIDLALYLIRGARGLDQSIRSEAIQLLSAEESGLVEGWTTHVTHAIVVSSRFARPPGATRDEDGK
ncbi:MAG: hypothetical protein ACRDQZ_13075 [Mycobacteriales bacterium]